MSEVVYRVDLSVYRGSLRSDRLAVLLS